MTNEEKAKIENPYKQYDGEWMQGYLSGMFEEGFCSGARWKEQQFDSMIIKFFYLIQDGISYERAYKQVTGKDWHP